MSGHSKWATIKRDKEANDAKKGALFTKFSKDITIAAKAGGGDIATNSTLALAISKAKSANMSNDKIQRAIDKGLGVTKAGTILNDISYEAYGPGDVAMIIDVSTDNKNRTLGDVKSMVEKSGGRFVEGGAVSWLFESKGWIYLVYETEEEEKKRENIKWGDKSEVKHKINKSNWPDLELEIMDQEGVLDIVEEENGISIYTTAETFGTIKKFLDAKNLLIEESEIMKKAKTTVEINGEDQEKISNLVSKLEDYDDVSDVWLALQ
jgi:YebC/PmpR family DNA-binding regulatory protein